MPESKHKSFLVRLMNDLELVVHAIRIIPCSNGDKYYFCSEIKPDKEPEQLRRHDAYEINKLVYNESIVICETSEGRCRPHKVTINKQNVFPTSCEVEEGDPTPIPESKDSCPHCGYVAAIGYGTDALLVVRSHTPRHNGSTPVRARRQWHEAADPRMFEDDGLRSDAGTLLACPKCRKIFLSWKPIEVDS